MPSNPLASAGFTNRDYAAAVAALASEAINQGVEGLALVADVAKNRMENARFTRANYGQKGTSLADVFSAKFTGKPSEFNGMDTKLGKSLAKNVLNGNLKALPEQAVK